MARKKNLAGLAALAGLAYMATRDREGKGGAPVVDAPAAVPGMSKAAEMDPLEAANNSPISQKIMEDAVSAGNEEKGGRMLDEMRDAGAPKRGTRSATAKTPSNPDYGNEGRRTATTAKAPAGADYGNEGRRVSTSTKAPAKTPTIAEPSSKTAYETPYDRMNRRNREEAEAKAEADAETRKLLGANPAPRRKPLPLTSTKAERNDFMGSTGLKKGGSVKGWGIARGSRKAKTY